jgi:hypothetical protein
MVGRCLAGLAALAFAAGDHVQAATLLAAAWQRFDAVPPFLAPCDEDDYQQVRREVGAALHPTALAEAWGNGQSLAPQSLLPVA